jgi:hypothetical protein|tara:strand:+ start:744 stop:1031 length:288 start_codon:yes stop_codon:yes gene_type:complete
MSEESDKKILEDHKELVEEYEKEKAIEEYWEEEERYKNSLEPKLDSIINIVEGIKKRQKSFEWGISFILLVIFIILVDNAFMGQLWESNFSKFLS